MESLKYSNDRFGCSIITWCLRGLKHLNDRFCSCGIIEYCNAWNIWVMLFCSKIMYDICECNVRHLERVLIIERLLCFTGIRAAAILALCVVVNMNATILGHAWRRLWLRVISSRTVWRETRSLLRRRERTVASWPLYEFCNTDSHAVYAV